MRPTDSNVSLHRDGEGHVDGRTEGDSGHRVEHVDVQLGEEGGLVEPGTNQGDGGATVYWNIRHDVSEMFICNLNSVERLQNIR